MPVETLLTNRSTRKALVQRNAGIAAAAVLSVLLGGCGSGAVTAPAPTTPATPLAVSPPNATLFADFPTTFTPSGGTAPYSAFSSNSTVLPITATASSSPITVTANPVASDTEVDVTVRDAANAAVTAKALVKPSVLNNQVTFTPLGPTGTGCNGGLCSGGDAQVVVKAVLNGVVLRARPIRFDVYQGSFQIVTPGSGTQVNSLLVNTDEQGEAVVRITATASAPTQVASLQSTDTVSGLARRFNFNILQTNSGVGVLSTLPSGTITIKGPKGLTGQDGTCPFNTRVDYFVYGGTPPYTMASPLPSVAAPINSAVFASGGNFGVNVIGCGKVSMIVTDSRGLAVETGQIDAQQGDKGDAAAGTTLTVAPTNVTVGCASSASVNLVGSGNFTTTLVTAGVDLTKFTITPTAGGIPSVITFSRAAASSQPTTIVVNVVAGATVTPITITTPAVCP